MGQARFSTIQEGAMDNFRLQVLGIECIEPEEFLDEIHVLLRKDTTTGPVSSEFRRYSAGLGAGDTPFYSNFTINFKTFASVQLLEDDWSGDVNLGSFIVTGGPDELNQVFTRTIKYKHDGGFWGFSSDATYNVTCTVTKLTAADAVAAEIQAFATSPKALTSKAWQGSGLKLSDIITEIKDRVLQPNNYTASTDARTGAYLVRQGLMPWCGPAAILFELIRRRPLFYVKLCRELWESGTLIGSVSHNISSTARSFKKFTSKKEANDWYDKKTKSNLIPDDVDWMVMLSMRDSTGVEAAPNYLFRFTTMWEMKLWTIELLGFPASKVHVDSYKWYSAWAYFDWGELGGMKEAGKAVNSGGVGFLRGNGFLIHPDGSKEEGSPFSGHIGSMLRGTPQDPTEPYPSYKYTAGKWWKWDSGHYLYSMYCWGKWAVRSLSEDEVEDYIMWAVWADD